MIKIVNTIAACVLSTSLFAQSPANIKSIEIGTAYPQLEAKTVDVISGKKADFKSVTGENGVLVIFTCNTCPYVIKNQDRSKTWSEYAIKNKINVIYINSNEAQRDGEDGVDKMKAYAAQEGYSNYYLDKNSSMANLFGATRTPELFLFDKSGKLVYKGAFDDNPTDATQVNEHFLKNAIDNLLAGKPINPASTKSVGCTIKRVKI